MSSLLSKQGITAILTFIFININNSNMVISSLL